MVALGPADGSMSIVTTISKLDIAVSQLRHAIGLFQEGEELISVITLAGAAEGILGGRVQEKGLAHALNCHVSGVVALWKHVFKRERKPARLFVGLANKTRNELKHYIVDKELTDLLSVDLEREAVRMLDRAVKNYKLLHARPAPFIREYEQWRYGQEETT